MTTIPHSKRSYTVTGLIKGTATPDEIRALLLNWRSDETPQDYARRVQEEGIITKLTAKRVNDLVLRVFRPWFLTPDNRAATRLKSLVEAGVDRRVLTELVFLYKARRETVLHDFVIEQFWPACNEGALYLRTQDIEDFLREAQEKGRAEKAWSSYTQTRLAYGILGALFEAGYLREERRYSREYVFYRVSDFTLAYLAYDFHLAGLTDSALAEHPDWGLFGLDRAQVLLKLSELDTRAGLVVQQAGSVVRISWKHETMDEVIDAYFG
ncbi:MAG: BrxA family protein [Anaerolineales bacterium]